MTTPAQIFPVQMQSLIDGDTLHVALSHAVIAPFAVTLTIERKLRLAGINCPELKTPDGMKARDFTAQWLLNHAPPYTIAVHGSGLDKYSDRIDGRLIAADGHCLNDDLLAAGQAVVMKD
jgi:endonuclease YncB( thermonuclease family)